MTPTEPQQSTAWKQPIVASDDIDDLLDEEGRIVGSPANDEGIGEDGDE